MILFAAMAQSPGYHGGLHFFCVFLLNLIGYVYLCLKFFKVLCYSKMTFDWLPMVNPYIWPFSIFRILTKPYFLFWSKNLPSIKSNSASIEISAIVGLEVLNSLLYFCVRISGFLVQVIYNMELGF